MEEAVLNHTEDSNVPTVPPNGLNIVQLESIEPAEPSKDVTDPVHDVLIPPVADQDASTHIPISTDDASIATNPVVVIEVMHSKVLDEDNAISNATQIIAQKEQVIEQDDKVDAVDNRPKRGRSKVGVVRSSRTVVSKIIPNVRQVRQLRKIIRKDDMNDDSKINKSELALDESAKSVPAMDQTETTKDLSSDETAPAVNDCSTDEKMDDSIEDNSMHESNITGDTDTTPEVGKVQAPGGKRLSPYQTMLRCLDRSVLHDILTVGNNQYRCPICGVNKNHVGYMILHIRVHKDLSSIFESYKNAGGTMKKISTVLAGDATMLDKSEKKTKMQLVKGAKMIMPSREMAGKCLRQRVKKHDLGYYPGNGQKLNRKTKATEKITLTANKASKKNGTSPSTNIATAQVGIDVFNNHITGDKNNIQVHKYNCRKKPIEAPIIQSKVSDTDASSLPHSTEETTAGSDGDWSPSVDLVKTSNAIMLKKPRIVQRLDKTAKKRVVKKHPLRLKQSSAYTQNKAKSVVPSVAFRKQSSLNRKIATLLKKDLVGKVSVANPHICRFCGKIFYAGTGLHFHYMKHTNQIVASRGRKPRKRNPNIDPVTGKPFDRAEFAFDELVTALKREEQENEAGLLKELGDDVNVLVEQLVDDDKVLKCLGWPNRDAGELVIDILERCELEPSRVRLNIMSPLQCLRKNVYELLTFCIKESAMESYGWNRSENVDEVIKEIIGGRN